MKKMTLLITPVLFLNAIALAQTNASDDNESITKTALDYIEGWYAGDAARMERALHPELAKRMISTDPKTGRSQFNHMGAMTLVQRTRDGGANARHRSSEKRKRGHRFTRHNEITE